MKILIVPSNLRVNKTIPSTTSALRGIVDASLSLPKETLIDLGTELGDKAYVERALTAHQLELDLADPDKAWANLLNDPTIYREENFFRIKYVANALIDKYGAAEADDLLSAITSPALSFKLRKSILSKIALSEPETAFNFAMDTPKELIWFDACNCNRHLGNYRSTKCTNAGTIT